MTREELKDKVDGVLGTNSVVEVLDAPEAKVYTDCWCIDMKEINKLQERGIETLTILSEGGKITLVVKL